MKDKFLADPNGLSQCVYCKHKQRGSFCDAFKYPNEIPMDILTNEFEHTSPYPGDNGIMFEATKGTKSPFAKILNIKSKIQKFNSAHDNKGRFASKAGSGGGAGDSVDVNVNLATTELATNLNREWTKEFKEFEGPFWNTKGETKPKYYVARKNGKLVGGATTVQKGITTEILSISSHNKGTGTQILDSIKSKNIFVSALASSKTSKEWFQKKGFILRNKANTNVFWRKPTK